MNLNGALLFNCKSKNLKIHELNNLNGQTNSVNQICFSPDENILVSGSEDQSICLWNVKTGSKIDGHPSIFDQVCFSSDGKTLASGSADQSICLWDVKIGKEILPADKDNFAQYKASLAQNNFYKVFIFYYFVSNKGKIQNLYINLKEVAFQKP